VKPTDLVALLQEFYRERLAMVERHKAVAAQVRDYNANNAYQYVINREDVHLTWLQDAIAEFGGAIPDAPPHPPLAIGSGPHAWRSLAGDDAREAEAFVARWRARVEGLTHARNRTMLRLTLGEVQEQARFFAQAAEARADLLGKNLDGSPTRGFVASSRWLGD